jgi:hypothetical protein
LRTFAEKKTSIATDNKMRSKEEFVATNSTTSPHVRDRRMERFGGRFDSPTVRERPNKNLVKTKRKTSQNRKKSSPKQTKNP